MFEEVVTTDNADKARAYFLRFEYVRIQIPSGTTSIGELAFLWLSKFKECSYS